MNKKAFVLSEIITKAIPFLFIPYLTNRLGTEGMGELALFQMYWAFFLPLLNASFDSCLNRYYFKYGSRLYPVVLMLILGVVVILTALILCALYFMGSDSIYILAVVTSSLNSIFIILSSVFHIRERYYEYSFYQVLNAILLVFINVIIFELYFSSVEMRALAIILTFSVVCFSLAISVRKVIFLTSFKLNNLKLSIFFISSFCLPLIINGYSNFIRSYIDRYFIDKYYSINELGVYSLAFQLSGVIVILVAALNKAFIPNVYRNIKNGDFFLIPSRNLNIFTLGFSIISFVIVENLPKELWIAIFGQGFEEINQYLFPLLMYAIAHCYYFYYSNFLFYMGKTKLTLYATLASMFVQIPYVLLISPKSLVLLSYSPLISLMSCILVLFILSKITYKSEF